MPPIVSPMGRGRALARCALAGNPSDGYGGAVLSMTLANFQAWAQASRAARLRVEPASQLVEATVARFSRDVEPAAGSTRLGWRTSIPARVGLGGSSALVVATLRALCDLYEVRLEAPALAEVAVAVEREELGIVGGLQDQFVQTHEGLLFIDFARPEVRALDPGLLPPLLIGYRSASAQSSGLALLPLRRRYQQGEEAVLRGLTRLRSLARQARDALLAGERERFAQAVDGTFDGRREMMPLDPRHVAMVQRAREAGAAANYTGSGGAVVCVCRDAGHRRAVSHALAADGCRTFVPRAAIPARSGGF